MHKLKLDCSIQYKIEWSLKVYSVKMHQPANHLFTGATGVVGAGGARPPPTFHILTKDMSLNRGATHFTLGLRQCIISSFLI